jgi:hypothetical protein
MTTETRTATIMTAACLVASASPLQAQRGPAAAWTHLPAQVLELACAPVSAAAPRTAFRLTGGQEGFAKRMYAPGDLVTINAGGRTGIEVGQEFFVRRSIADHHRATAAPAIMRTAGWIRVHAVDETLSLATITYACDAIELGDFLEPFVLPTVPVPATDPPEPERGNYGRVLTGRDGRTSFGKGDFFVVDRGGDHGVIAGMRFVMYRDPKVADNFLYSLGEAVAVAVGPQSSTLLVTVSHDAIRQGDYVAMRREITQ